MSTPLHLEYACTAAELEEAQSLNLRRQLGAGSKWLTRLVLGLLLAGVLWVFNYQIAHSFSAAYRPLVWAGTVVLFLLFYFNNRREARKRVKDSPLAQVDLSENEITFVTDGSKLVKPWSAFSECIESENLFVLRDRSKVMLLIFPKRAFPDENWQTWFRNQTSRFTQPVEMSPRIENLNPATLTAPSGIRITVQLGFRDYLDRMFASWWPRIVIGLVLGLQTVSAIFEAAHASPNQVNSPFRVLLLFEIPCLLIVVGTMMFVLSAFQWRAYAKRPGPEEIIFSDESMTFAGAEGAGVLPWTTYTWFKETRRSFILWQRGTAAWVLLPKRQFRSAEEVSHMRTLLTQHLKPSGWLLR